MDCALTLCFDPIGQKRKFLHNETRVLETKGHETKVATWDPEREELNNVPAGAVKQGPIGTVVEERRFEPPIDID